MKEQTAEWINRLGRFCGKRDVPELTPDQLYRKYQIRQADVLVLFGGSILCGGDVLADAMKQDAAMQRRMDAGLRKQNADALIINFAAYQAEVTVRNGEPEYEKEIWGMWDMDRYITLLMGEIPRLSDAPDGYGPAGKNFIAHVDIPPEVAEAFSELKKEYGGMVREANPMYAS